MERLFSSFEALPDLWGRELYEEVAEAEAGEDFKARLTRLRDNIEARLVALQNQQRTTAQRQGTLTAHDITGARRFLGSVYMQPNEKLSIIKTLKEGPLAVAAVLFTVNDVTRQPRLQEAIVNGASRIAKWSTWPKDKRMKDLLQQFRGRIPLIFLERRTNIRSTSSRSRLNRSPWRRDLRDLTAERRSDCSGAEPRTDDSQPASLCRQPRRPPSHPPLLCSSGS